MSTIPIVKFTKTDARAVSPVKGNNLAIGYDLTAIEVYKKLNSKTTLYNTGIRVSVPNGYYTEIVPRSSLSKTGYMLSNSVGIIDPDYTDNLLLALTKVDENSPDLEVPFTRCQLILRKAEYYNVEEVENILETGRGSFGSTDLVKN